MKSYVFLLVAVLAFLGRSDQSSKHKKELRQAEICKPMFCSNSSMNSDVVQKYCDSNGKIQDRCCYKYVNETETEIIGIDYTSCEIDHLSDATYSLDKNLLNKDEENLRDIRNNTFKECSSGAYAGFVKLDKLYLPDSCHCPGSNYSWSVIDTDSCKKQKPICNSAYPNSNCTSNSICSENGPGNFLCECKDGYHGYKCLNQGAFPSLIFTTALCVSTLVLSGILWHTQRRHVKQN